MCNLFYLFQLKCRRNHQDSDVVICQFNSSHHIRKVRIIYFHCFATISLYGNGWKGILFRSLTHGNHTMQCSLLPIFTCVNLTEFYNCSQRKNTTSTPALTGRSWSWPFTARLRTKSTTLLLQL